MTTVAHVAAFLNELAPSYLAEEWDNVGLLVGDPEKNISAVMTCLTLTPQTADEAVARKADLVVTHHPLPFHSLKRITTDTPEGRVLLKLIGSNTAIYSSHTAYDSAPRGINQRLAEGLRLQDVEPLVTGVAGTPGSATGRVGRPTEDLSLARLAESVKQLLGLSRVRMVGPDDLPIEKVAVACGASGSLLDEVRRSNCQAMVLGETRFHTCLEAEAHEIGLVMPGHFASEQFALVHLAEILAEQFADLEIWSSRTERDPIHWL